MRVKSVFGKGEGQTVLHASHDAEDLRTPRKLAPKTALRLPHFATRSRFQVLRSQPCPLPNTFSVYQFDGIALPDHSFHQNGTIDAGQIAVDSGDRSEYLWVVFSRVRIGDHPAARISLQNRYHRFGSDAQRTTNMRIFTEASPGRGVQINVCSRKLGNLVCQF